MPLLTKLVILDFDRTLCTLFDDAELTEMAAVVRSLLPLDVDPLPSAVAEDPYALWGELRKFMVSGPADLLQAKAEDEIRAQLSLWEEARAESVELYSDTAQVLQTLAAANIPIVIFSNNSRLAIETVLVRFNIGQFVQSVIGREPEIDIRLLKPSTKRLETKLTELDISAYEATYVGDSVEDRQCASSAGVRFLGVPSTGRPRLDVGPDAMLPGIGALPMRIGL